MTNQRGSIIPVIALLFGAAVVVLIFGYRLWPKDSDVNITGIDVSKVVKNGNANGNTNANTNVNSNANANTNANATPEVLPAGVKRFTSATLGIAFTYLEKEGGVIQEIGNTIYVGGSRQKPTDGQWVEVMSKDTGDTLAQAIQKKYLTGVDSSKCYIEDVKITGLPSTVTTAIIGYPVTEDPQKPWWENQKNCPAGYSKTNGIRFFWMDSEHPDKLLFFSIGQYGINGLNDNYETTWEKTVRVTGTYDPTAGWKTEDV